MKRHRYTHEELAQAWRADQLHDADCAERHAAEIDAGATHGTNTAAGLRAYAQECRETAARPIPKEFAHQ